LIHFFAKKQQTNFDRDSAQCDPTDSYRYYLLTRYQLQRKRLKERFTSIDLNVDSKHAINGPLQDIELEGENL
jgi:hypothetical protein